MRRLVVAYVVMSLLSFSSESGAQQPPDTVDCGNTPSGGIIYCSVDRNGSVVTEVGGGSSTPRDAGTARSAIRYVPYNQLTTDSSGQGCVRTGYVQEGTTPNDAAPANPDQPQGAGGYNNVYAEYPPCPDQPRAPGQPAPVVTRALLAARYWEEVPLPSPRPYIAPGRAITGKTAYLETQGQTTETYTKNTGEFGTLRIVATGTYFVDWGDGEATGPHTIEGRRWPEGQITHNYIDVGTYDIIVTEKWTAVWALGGETGVLRTLQTSGRLDDFSVEQIQAVVRR